MEKMTLIKPIQLVAKQVKTFPNGIGQTFDNLANTLPDGMQRAYYGISWMEHEKVIYYAAAEQKATHEINKYSLEPWTIESGEYLFIPVLGWRSKTDSIKDVFGTLMNDTRTDKTKPCVEWYQTDERMLCMMKTLDK